jgi:hypothetical protein
MNPSGEKGVENSSVPPFASGQPSIRFPALSFSHGLINVIHSLDALSQTNKLGLKRGYHKDLILVDSAGDQFQVMGARRIRTLPFRLTFGDFLEFLGANPRLQVELIFRPGSSRITVDELKNLILGSFKREKYYWEEMTDFEEFRRSIESADSVQEIFDAFSEFNKA